MLSHTLYSYWSNNSKGGNKMKDRKITFKYTVNNVYKRQIEWWRERYCPYYGVYNLLSHKEITKLSVGEHYMDHDLLHYSTVYTQ